ncbi:MAG: glycosylase [Clostridia bacterium]|nr:glycosylase [Clostridia bacterium]
MIPFAKNDLPGITEEEMVSVYEKMKTPVKRGAVVKWENDFTDSPTVFQKDGVFYMYFIAISKDCSVSGYETHLASSVDLVNWEYRYPVFRRNDLDRWDSRQCAGYAAFKDIAFEGTNGLIKPNGSYYLSYLGGNSDGYEPDPLYMGLARSDDPTRANSFVRFDAPILRPDDPDSRPMEKKTLYKSCMFRDELGVTGFPYVNIYNAKAENGTERIFLAVSSDGERWERYGDSHVFDMTEYDPDTLITGDPQIVLVDGLYVMLFFHCARGRGAYNSFAVSRDLVSWKPWQGKPLVAPEMPWENVHAHKPWFVRHGGVNYHFYCAVNDSGERFIALATSE